MSYQVVITPSAERDAIANRDWWAEHRSQEQADRWFVLAYQTMLDLANTADRYTYATEAALKSRGVRQVAFGLGKRPTHRLLYGFRDDTVEIYRVRAFKQDAIGIEGLKE